MAVLCAASFAQSSVQIYGSIDGGIDYLNNAGGSSLTAVNSGKRSPDRLGFRGQEDLGGGLSAGFRLETGLNSDVGTSANATAFFNRYAQVFIAHKQLGSLTFGHMPEFMYEYVAAYANTVPGVSAAFSPGNLDNLANQFQFDNAVKYESPEIAGLQAGAMNGFGESNSGFSTNRRWGLGARYRNGGLKLGAAHTMIVGRNVDLRTLFGVTSFMGQALPAGTQFASTRYRIQGLSAAYTVGMFTPHVLVSDVSIGNALGNSSERNVQAGVIVDFAQNNRVNVSVARTTFFGRQFLQTNLFASHNLSKSVQVYAGLSRATAQGPAGTTAGVSGYTKSSTDSQNFARVGFHYLF